MPRIGPMKNCITPQVTANTTFHSDAVAVSPPVNCLIRLGRIGIMIPNETAFITAEAKMKPNAARRPDVDPSFPLPSAQRPGRDLSPSKANQIGHLALVHAPDVERRPAAPVPVSRRQGDADVGWVHDPSSRREKGRNGSSEMLPQLTQQ